MRLFNLIMLMAAPLLLVPVADATPITFVANLTQALEVPPTGSPGTGEATVIIDPIANTLHVDVTFSGLEAGTTASPSIAAWHLHSRPAPT